MKIENETNSAVISRGVQRSIACTVNNSKNAFEVLAGMYSNPIRAIVRELGTNAYDSHIEAENSAPFDVHCPSLFEAYFYVRDYGTGMSQEKMETLYTNYLESDKTDSNLMVGCLGIGSKSPFTYTRQFTVTSFYHGTKFVYILNLNDEDLPELNLFGEFQTDEPNGVKVEFIVESGDFNKFTSECEAVYKFFVLKPNFVGESQPTILNSWNIEDAEMSDSSWSVKKGHKSIAVMGNVAYPISAEMFRNNKNDSSEYAGIVPERYKALYNSENKYVDLINYGIMLNFDIGEISFAPSREALKYNNKTINIIKEKIDIIYDVIVQYFQNQTTNAQNYFEACKIYTTLKVGKYAALAQMCFKNKFLEFGGRKLSETYDIQNKYIFVEQCHIRGDKLEKQKTHTIRFDDHTVLVERDTDLAPYARIKHKLIDGIQIPSTVYLVSFLEPPQPKLPANPLVQSGNTPSLSSSQAVSIDSVTPIAPTPTLSDFCLELGCDQTDIIKLSSLPKPPPNKYTVKRIPAMVFDAMHSRANARNYWNEQEIDVNLGGVYVEVCRYQPIKTHLSNDIIRLVKSKFVSWGISTPQIVGIKSFAMKPFLKQVRQSGVEWSTFRGWAEKNISEYIKTNNFERIILDIKTYTNDKESIDSFLKMARGQGGDGLLNDFLGRLGEIRQTYKDFSEKVGVVIDIAAMLGYNLPTGQEMPFDYQGEEKKIYEVYDFLSIVPIHEYNNEIVRNLIRLYDTNNKLVGASL